MKVEATTRNPMSQWFAIHPDNPQARLIRQAVTYIQEGGLIVYPTDSGYALGCQLGNKACVERIRQLRQLDKHHLYTLMCRDLSELGTYAKVSKPIFRLLKAFTPGSYTFILNATHEVPKLLLNVKRKTLGLRIPNNTIALSLLEALDAPLMSSTLKLPGAETAIAEPDAIRDLLGNRVDLIIDGGNCGYQPTTIVDLTEDVPSIVRQGGGDTAPFLT